MDDNKAQNKHAEKIKITMMEDEFNSLFSVLSAYIEAAESSYGQFASYMINEKFMKYSRTYERNGSNRIEIGLFPNEAQNLINLFVVYESIFQKPTENYYEKVIQNKR